MANSRKEHDEFPNQCSTAYLEALETKSKNGEDVDPSFLKELSRRRSMPKARTIRLARLAAWLEGKMEKAKHNQMYSGDVRKMRGK